MSTTSHLLGWIGPPCGRPVAPRVQAEVSPSRYAEYNLSSGCGSPPTAASVLHPTQEGPAPPPPQGPRLHPQSPGMPSPHPRGAPKLQGPTRLPLDLGGSQAPLLPLGPKNGHRLPARTDTACIASHHRRDGGHKATGCWAALQELRLPVP